MFERFTHGSREAVIRARQEAIAMRHDRVGTEHILVALLADPGGTLGALLGPYGLDADRVRAEIMRRVGRGDATAEEVEAADADALRAIGIDLDAVRAKIEEAFGPGALDLPPPEPRQRVLRRRARPRSRFSDRSKKCLELALREALRLGHTSIRPEHVLLGILRDGKGLAALILVDAGVDLVALRGQVERALQERAA
jgi:ATP-dependent Clp protease ATP-binding subunit ClpA